MRYSPLFTIDHSSRFWGASRLVALAISLSTATVWGRSAQALEFNFGATATLSQDIVTGLNVASENWKAVLTDDVTVTLSVSAQDSQSSTLGTFRPQRVNVSYRNFVNALNAETVQSSDDETALSYLPKSRDFDLLLNPEFDLLINGTRNHPSGQPGDLTPYVDDDGDCNNRLIRLTTANAKAIGLPRGGTSNCASSPQTVTNDGSLNFNTNIPWDFDPTDGITDGHYDFVGVATQGLGVALGFISGVDVLDFNTTPITDTNPKSFDDNVLAFVSPSDLFRFSADSLAIAPLNQSQSLIDWTTGRTDTQGQEVDKYFSIDGGQTKIARFSTGQQFGDGNRASSWKSDNLTGSYLGIFEPSPEFGQRLFMTENDRRLLDVIGWDLDSSFLPPTSPSNGNPPPSNGNPPPSNGNPPPTSHAVPEPGHGLGAATLVAIALFRFARKRDRTNE